MQVEYGVAKAFVAAVVMLEVTDRVMLITLLTG
jgi:hypothetical protein